MAYDKERTARRIKSLRADKGWDQIELANQSGVSVDTIRRAESASQCIGLDKAVALADALGCTIDELACRTKRSFD